MKKSKRHQAIFEILEKEGGSTHEQIRALLDEMGIIASQSTLSRDLREMGAVKAHVAGASVYQLPSTAMDGQYGSGLSQAMSEFVTGCETIGNFLVIKTRPGTARDFCLVLDRQKWGEVVGTLAGDDTILVICRNGQDITTIKSRLGCRG